MIADKEYEASRNDEDLQAPNRAHDLRTYFEATGIRVVARTAAGGPKLLEPRFVGFGRGDFAKPVSPGVFSSEGARVEIRRPGLVEWLVNEDFGLEHGFTVESRTEGEGSLVLVDGRASFEDRNTIRVGQESIRASQIIIATGTQPRVLPGVNVDAHHIVTSDEIMRVDSLPESLVVLGGRGR